MSSSSISGVSSAADAAAEAAAAGSSELDRQAFLNLLIAQLQNQDPLEPQANAEFVAQLAQFSSLEQLTTANDALASLYAAMASMNNATMTQLLGMQVTAYGDTFAWSGEGEATLWYDAESATASATLTITDEDGEVVYTEELGALEEGEGSVTWNGQTTSGETAAEGEYTFTIEAEDADGEEVTVDTLVKGEIDGMSFETGTPVPSIGGVDIELGDILEVSSGEAEDEEEEGS